MTGRKQTVDFDLHGVVGVRLLDARPEDVAAVERQLGPIRSPGLGEPDLSIRFVDRLETRGRVRLLGLDQFGFSEDAFLVLRSKHKARARVSIPMDRIGDRCEIVCEHGLPAVPLLVPIVNLTALAKEVLPLHAAAFGWQGSGVVVTGWSKGGKTETLLAFAGRGARYVADEWCYLAPDGRRVFGVPEPVRLWHWQLRQLPDVWRRIPWSERARLAALSVVPGLEERLPEALKRRAAGRLARRAARLVAGQLHTQVPPERLFGQEVGTSEATFDHLLLVTSTERPQTEIRPVDPEEVADRMVHSLQVERLPLLEAYETFRFAFPGRWNRHLEKAEDRQRTLLRRAFAGKPAHVVEHPYPVELATLFERIEPRLRPGGHPCSPSHS